MTKGQVAAKGNPTSTPTTRGAPRPTGAEPASLAAKGPTFTQPPLIIRLGPVAIGFLSDGAVRMGSWEVRRCT
jgi:hypothetical protein